MRLSAEQRVQPSQLDSEGVAGVGGAAADPWMRRTSALESRATRCTGRVAEKSADNQGSGGVFDELQVRSIHKRTEQARLHMSAKFQSDLSTLRP